MKVIFAFVLFCLTFLSKAQSTYSKETLKNIQEVETSITTNLILNNEPPSSIDQRMAEYNVKGMSIAVIHDYKVVWAKGYGWADEASKTPVTTETLFEPGSISKTLNAVGILKLAQEGKVDLTADINTYLKTWRFPYDSLSNGKHITLAHLLSHTAGLTVHGFPGHGLQDPQPTIYQVLNGEAPSFTPAVRSLFEPGLYYQYSGGGTSISQVILTDITGEPYETWMYNNVLWPIGMTHSTYAQPPSPEVQKQCATAYRGDGSALEGRFHMYPEQAAAGLWMTPTDLANYSVDMQLAYKGQKSKVLNAEMIQLHLSPYNDGPSAMGTFIDNFDGARYFSHGAGNDGFRGQFFGSLDDGNGVVVFLNGENQDIMYEVINSVAKVYKWKNFYREPRRVTTINVPDKIIDAYKGIYLFENGWSAIGKKEGTYHFFDGQSYAAMHFTTPKMFVTSGFPEDREMIQNDKGEVTGYNRKVTGRDFSAAIKVLNTDTLQLENQMFMEMAWYLFETKQYDEALAYYKRAIALNPDDLNLKMNMAHTMLFKGDNEAALAVYKSHVDDTISPGFTWRQSLLADYQYFRDNKYDTVQLEKIMDYLNVTRPK